MFDGGSVQSLWGGVGLAARRPSVQLVRLVLAVLVASARDFVRLKSLAVRWVTGLSTAAAQCLVAQRVRRLRISLILTDGDASVRSDTSLLPVARDCAHLWTAICSVLGFLMLGGCALGATLETSGPFDGYTVAVWTETDTVPLSQTFAIAQDHEGYIWIGAPDGLLRFDGSQFTPWHPRDPDRLPTGVIAGLSVDQSGALWIAFAQGSVTRIADGRVTNFERLAQGYGTTITQTADKTVWAGGTAGLARFRDGVWTVVGAAEGLPQPARVQKLFVDHANTLWASTSRGVYYKTTSTSFRLADPTSYVVQSFSESLDGVLWMTDPVSGATTVPGSLAQHPTPHFPQHTNGRVLLHDSKDNFWIGTSGQGLYRVYAKQQGHPPTIEHLGDAEHIVNSVVWSLLEDRDGNIWVGVPGGLYRLSMAQEPFAAQHLFTQRVVTAVASDGSGPVWLAATDGLLRVSPSSTEWYESSPVNPSSRNPASVLHVDSQGALWIGRDGGLRRLFHERFSEVALPDDFSDISALATDADGALWVCDGSKGVYRLFSNEPRKVLDLADTRCLSMTADSRGDMWIGLAATRPDTLARYSGTRLNRYSQADGLASGNVNAIFEDSHHTVWVRTRDGLSRLIGDRFVTVDFKRGLPRSILGGGMIEDSGGFLWVSTSSGLARFKEADFNAALSRSSASLKFTFVATAHVTAPGGAPTMALDNTGHIWSANGNGVLVLDPTHSPRRSPPPVRIDNLVVNGERIFPSSYNEIGPGVATLAIEYGALALNGEDYVQFRYRLQGFDTDWIDAGSRHEAYYTNLGPGRYRFEVAASKGDDWGTATASVVVYVTPAFYQRWSFFAISGSAVLFLTGVGWHMRVRQVERRSEEVLAERARIAREIHDSVLQNIASSAIRLGMIARDVGTSPERAVAALNLERRRSEQLLRDTRRAVKALRSPRASGILARDIRDTIQPLLEGRSIKFQLTVTGSPAKCEDWIEDHIVSIAHEAVMNVVRHACASSVDVDLTYGTDSVTLQVTDDGTGFTSEDIATPDSSHIGLMIMRERAGLITGHLEICSAPGRGTTIQVVVPLSSNKQNRH